MNAEQERTTGPQLVLDALVDGDMAPDRATLVGGLGRVEWYAHPAKVVLNRMTPAHMRNLAQTLVGLAADAEETAWVREHGTVGT